MLREVAELSERILAHESLSSCCTPNLNARAYIPSIFGTTTPISSSGGNFCRYRAEKPNGVFDLNWQRGYRPNTYKRYAGPSIGPTMLAPLVGGPYAAL